MAKSVFNAANFLLISFITVLAGIPLLSLKLSFSEEVSNIEQASLLDAIQAAFTAHVADKRASGDIVGLYNPAAALNGNITVTDSSSGDFSNGLVSIDIEFDPSVPNYQQMEILGILTKLGVKLVEQSPA
jgi:hypothetical protein